MVEPRTPGQGTSPLGGDRVVRKSLSAAWQRVDGEVVLLNVDGHELLGLNAIGGRVWDLIDGQRSIGQLVDALVAEFSAVPAATIAADVDRFVRELLAEKMIELV